METQNDFVWMFEIEQFCSQLFCQMFAHIFERKSVGESIKLRLPSGAQAKPINKWLKGDYYLWFRFRFNTIHDDYTLQSHWQLCRNINLCEFCCCCCLTIGNRLYTRKNKKKKPATIFAIEFWFSIEFRPSQAIIINAISLLLLSMNWFIIYENYCGRCCRRQKTINGKLSINHVDMRARLWHARHTFTMYRTISCMRTKKITSHQFCFCWPSPASSFSLFFIFSGILREMKPFAII